MAKAKTATGARKPEPKRIAFLTQVEGAKEVVLTGDFTGWAKDRIRLSRGPSGEWTGSVDLAPGEYQYRLLVDGQWRDDPDAKARVANSFGTENCVLTIT